MVGGKVVIQSYLKKSFIKTAPQITSKVSHFILVCKQIFSFPISVACPHVTTCSSGSGKPFGPQSNSFPEQLLEVPEKNVKDMPC